MQDRHDLEKQLERLRERKWVDSRIKRLTRWPEKRRSILRELIAPSKDLLQPEDFEERIQKAQRYFEDLNDKERKALWDGLFPQLSSHLERAWQDAGERLFQSDYPCSPFRAPHRAESVARCRAWFFVAACDALNGFDQDVKWLAAWGPHLTSYLDSHVGGWILGAALRGGGTDAEAVRTVLIDSINGQHETGEMGYHAVVAMLNSDLQDDWEVIGKLLLAAQRQEGLREVILEAVDSANPAAFRYMLGIILENDLARFSAMVRAFDKWLGMQWAGGSVKVVNAGLRHLAEFFDDDAKREKAIRQGEPEDAYLALWVTAQQDAEQAFRLAAPLLDEPSPERRFVAIKTIERLRLFPECLEVVASRFVSERGDDPRMQMAMMAFFSQLKFTKVDNDLFDATVALFEHLPAKRKQLQPIVWPWARYTLDRRSVAHALTVMATGSPDRLIPFAPAMETSDCLQIIGELSGTGEFWDEDRWRKRKRRKLTPQARKLILDLIGDPRQAVHLSAFEAISRSRVEEDEVQRLAGLLNRNAPTIRAAAIDRLIKLSDARAIEVVGELLSDKDSRKRAAGLELASHLVEAKRSASAVVDCVAKYRDRLAEPELTEPAERLLGGKAQAVSLDDCLGLVPARSRSALPPPKFVGVRIETDGAKACLKELGQLFADEGTKEIEIQGESTSQRVLLGSAGWTLPEPKRDVDSRTDARERLPLATTWLAWLAERSASTRDPDGLELVRAWAWTERGESYLRVLPRAFRKEMAWHLVYGFSRLMQWMPLLANVSGGGKLLVQYIEDTLAKDCPSPEEIQEHRDKTSYHADESTAAGRIRVVEEYLKRFPADVDSDCRKHLAALLTLALERDLAGSESGPSLELFTAAYDAGSLNEADFVWLLLHPRERNHEWGPSCTFGPIRDVSGLRPAKEIEGRPKLIEAVRRTRDRLVLKQANVFGLSIVTQRGTNRAHAISSEPPRGSESLAGL